MQVIVDLCIVPLGVGVSVSPYIAACQQVLADAHLKIALHAYGTNIEGNMMRSLPQSDAVTNACMRWARRASPLPSNWVVAPTASKQWPTK